MDLFLNRLLKLLKLHVCPAARDSVLSNFQLSYDILALFMGLSNQYNSTDLEDMIHYILDLMLFIGIPADYEEIDMDSVISTLYC
jgi:hypothetical protein